MTTRDDIDPTAAQGFEKAAVIYDEVRPSYPTEIIDFIKSLQDKPGIVVDVGAGTGKLTSLLGPLAAQEIIAVEPVAAMRENLKNIPLITKIIDGTAEKMPFDNNTIDLILCGQCFHWFANHRALAEFNRVLKPNGLLILVWNLRDTKDKPWVKTMLDYIDSLRSEEVPQYRTMQWLKAFENQSLFSELQYKQFVNSHKITRDLLIKGILSMSYIAMLPSEQQLTVTNYIRNILDNVEEIQNVDEFDAGFLTDVFWCSPLQSSS